MSHFTSKGCFNFYDGCYIIFQFCWKLSSLYLLVCFLNRFKQKNTLIGKNYRRKREKKQGRKDIPWKITRRSCQRDCGLFAKLLPIALIGYLRQTCELFPLQHAGGEAFPDTATVTQAARENGTVLITWLKGLS